MVDNFPLFPISIIIFPGEVQPLHIFEPRYKQLIHEMNETGGSFGIPYLKKDSICEYGSVVKVHKILACSPTGELDVLVRGERLFRINSIFEKLPGKLYGGGSVEFMDTFNKKASAKLADHFGNYTQQIKEIDQDKSKQIMGNPKQIFEIAGQLPLDIEEKYALIRAKSHNEREYLLIEKLNFLLMINKKLEEVGYRFYLN
ncbi:MAG TPA: LON peptidase substrate-binding domain-containing protein [Bacteroidales bacterium]|nr:LON peptidase substrate-binding domain-containing protein [Bacteroidales bacterium]